MFKNEYQGGPHFEIFSVQGKDPVANWKVTGGAGVRKAFDKEVKSFVYSLEGSVATTKMQLPKDPRHSLTLIQRYLIFQVYVPIGQDFSMEIGLTDLQNNKRRLFFSTSHKEVGLTPLHAKIPLSIMKRAMWLNLCLDMVSIVGETWRGQTFKATEGIILSANCKLRKIFSMKVQPPDDDDLYGNSNAVEIDLIPKQFQIPHDVPHCTQVINMYKIKHGDVKKSGELTNRPPSVQDIDLSASGVKRLGAEYHIAFGSKVPVPAPNSAQKKLLAGRDGLPSNRKSLSKSRSDELNAAISVRDTSRETYRDQETTREKDHNQLREGPLGDGHHRMSLDTGLVVEKELLAASEKGSDHASSGAINRCDDRLSVAPHPPAEEKQFVKPHPPSGPSSDRFRRRIHRVKGTGKEKLSSGQSSALKDIPYEDSISSVSVISSHPTKSSSYSTARSDALLKPKKSQDIPMRQRQLSSEEENEPVVSSKDDRKKKEYDRPAESGDSIPGLPEAEEELIIPDDNENGQGLSDDSLEEPHQLPDIEDADDSISDVIEALRAQAEKVNDPSEDEEVSDADLVKNSYEDSDEDNSNKRVYNADVYMFHSPPKQAPRRKADEDQRLQLSSSRLRVLVDRASSRVANPADDFRASLSSEDDDFIVQRSRLTPSPVGRHSRSKGPTPSPKGGRRRNQVANNIDANCSSAPNGKEKDDSVAGDDDVAEYGIGSRSRIDPVDYSSIVTNHNNAISGKGHMKLNKSLNTLSVKVPESVLLSPAGSQSRHSISKKKVREIPKDDARLSQLHQTTERPYNEAKYQMGDITDSFEAKMLASMKRQADESGEEDENDAEAGPQRSPRKHNANQELAKHVYGDDSPSSSGDDTTSFSTWKSPVPTLLPHHYQDEMHLPSSRTSQDTLGSSNPRDWSGVFSPPIILPSEMSKDPKPEDLSPRESIQQRQKSSDSKGRSRLNSQGETAFEQETDEEDELDLLYDPCLNCYFDPKTCRYYELV